jgi:CPA1 family monovalent cation:H+ antiporter
VTFGPIVRALGVGADPADAAALRNEARAAAAQAGLSRLDQITTELEVPGAALAGLRASLEGQLRRYQQAGAPDSATDSATDRTDGVDGTDGRDPASPAGPDQEAVLDTRRAVIDAEREELLRWRDAGRLPDASLRILNRELDHEERTVTSREGL